jgi:hypothetical protein
MAERVGYDRMKEGVGTLTEKGVRVDVVIYAYSEGGSHGNIVVDGTNHPVDGDIEAIDALVSLWWGARRRAKKRT